MDKEFLEGLGISPEAVEAILSKQQEVASAHQAQLSQLQLQHAVESAVHRAGGRNLKAVSALLDLESIGASQDIPAALDKALRQLKQENGYLFESPTPPPYAPFTGGANTPAPKVTTLAGALRERMKK